MITILTAIASGRETGRQTDRQTDRQRQRDIILVCYYLHYIPVSLCAVCTDEIELVSSPDPVVMETIKQTSSSHYKSHNKSHDTNMTYLDLMSL